jgi:hypothetical protein
MTERPVHQHHKGILDDYHKVTDGETTGYGSSCGLAERAYREAKEDNREYIHYAIPPEEDTGILVTYNHYGRKK